jgi:hypothetical protein
MKVIITENKLFNAIYDYINDSYDVPKLIFLTQQHLMKMSGKMWKTHILLSFI